MHRRITLQGDGRAIEALAARLAPVEGVLALVHHPGRSLKPPGDLLQIDVLNRDADEVLRQARHPLEDQGTPLTIVISQSTAIIDPAHAALIHADADEALWEEMESDLRNHGR